MKRKLELLISEYDEENHKSEKQILKFWKDLLDKFYQSKVPVKCDEEGILEVLIKDAEDIENSFKSLCKKNNISISPSKKDFTQ